MVTAGDGQVAGDPPFGPEFLEPNNDDNVYGDNMSPASSTTFRHYHININGISKQNDFVDAQNLANALQHIESDSTSIVEHNCNMHIPSVRNSLQDILRREDRRAATIFSHVKSESHKFDEYQPGGTLLQINSKVSSRITNRHSDEYARWSHATMSAKGGSRVHIISAYRVCQSSEASAGPNTAYMQQFRAMSANGVRSPKP